MARATTRRPSHNGASPSPHQAPGRGSTDEPDVFLHIPDLHVGEIRLDVENLEAHLALEARLANLVQIGAGAHVTIGNVHLDIKDVAAKAMLKVRLGNVYAILDRALTTLDRNPQIIQGVLDTVDNTVNDVAGPRGVLASTLDKFPRAGERKLPNVGSGLRKLVRKRHRSELVTKVATAAGVAGGAALVIHANGGVERTLKELTA